MDNKKFGQFIHDLRKEKGWTQEELAQKIYVTDKAVSKWERGLSFPDIELLMPLSEVFDVSVLELLKGEKDLNQNAKIVRSENEIVIETLNNSKNIFRKKIILPKWLKISLLIILIWITMFGVDYIRVSKFYSSPIFSIPVESKRTKFKDVDYLQKRYIGLGYSFYTRGENYNKKYTIDYGEIKFLKWKVKDFFRGVNS